MVSIIIPCWNQAKYIEDCIMSVINQTYKDIEIIVVDDCSTDESAEILSKCADKYNVRVIYHNENKGVSAARNKGIMESHGEYIVCLDGDDMLLPDSIRIRVKYFENNPNVDVVWAKACKINEKRGNYGYSYRKAILSWREFEIYSRRMNAQTIMWRRRVFKKYGLYYEGLLSKEDKELLYRLGLHPDSPMPMVVKARMINSVIVIYRRHPEAKHKRRIANKKWSDETERIFKDRIKTLKKEGITTGNTWFLA